MYIVRVPALRVASSGARMLDSGVGLREKSPADGGTTCLVGG
jgi:hypothetical protein